MIAIVATEVASPFGMFLWFLALITPLVFVHEMGHFLVARWCGVKVDIFSVGFGPEIIGKTDKHGTRWRISAIPMGGYVKFFGDESAISNAADGLDDLTDAERAVSFHHQSLPKRAAIVAAGPIVNFLFAIGIFAVLFTTFGQAYTPAEITQVEPGTVAEEAGLQTGDRITRVGDEVIDRFEELRQVIMANPGTPVDVVVDRGGSEVQVTVTPGRRSFEDRFGNTYEHGYLGVYAPPREFVDRGPFEAVYYGAIETVELVDMMLETLGQLVLGLRSIDELGGPVKIAQMTSERASLGFIAFVSFMALISINLGLVNLFPIPALDGGHLFYYALEALRGKPLTPRLQEMGYMAGITAVLSLLVLLTWNDLS